MARAGFWVGWEGRCRVVPKQKVQKVKKKVKKQVNGTSETRTRERQGPTLVVAIFLRKSPRQHLRIRTPAEKF